MKFSTGASATGDQLVWVRPGFCRKTKLVEGTVHESVKLLPAVVVNHPGESECEWLLDLERLPDKQKSWADIRLECAAAKGEYDMALGPLRNGVKKLVDKVRGRP